MEIITFNEIPDCPKKKRESKSYVDFGKKIKPISLEVDSQQSILFKL